MSVRSVHPHKLVMHIHNVGETLQSHIPVYMCKYKASCITIVERLLPCTVFGSEMLLYTEWNLII